jgi:hypothetical protein
LDAKKGFVFLRSKPEKIGSETEAKQNETKPKYIKQRRENNYRKNGKKQRFAAL